MGLTADIRKNERLWRYTWDYCRQRFRGYRIDAPPIFIVGCGHSGTTVLLRLLGAHSRIFAVPYESRVFKYPRAKQWLATRVWNRATVVHGKYRWVEKSPMHVRMIDRIFRRFPDARVLFIVRDGRDVSVSLRNRLGDFELGLRRWIDDNRQGLSWADDPRVKQLRYEALVKDYETTMRGVCEFIDEDFEPNLTEFHQKPAYIFSDNIRNPGTAAGDKHAEYRNWQINQRFFDGSGKWMTTMTAEEKALFKASDEAMQLQLEFGYCDSTDW